MWHHGISRAGTALNEELCSWQAGPGCLVAILPPCDPAGPSRPPSGSLALWGESSRHGGFGGRKWAEKQELRVKAGPGCSGWHPLLGAIGPSLFSQQRRLESTGPHQSASRQAVCLWAGQPVHVFCSAAVPLKVAPQGSSLRRSTWRSWDRRGLLGFFSERCRLEGPGPWSLVQWGGLRLLHSESEAFCACSEILSPNVNISHFPGLSPATDDDAQSELP